VLSQAEIDSFVADGFVAVRGALPAGVLQACQEEIWSDLGDHGVLRDDRGVVPEDHGPARRGPA
jgi:hypothetical protein